MDAGIRSRQPFLLQIAKTTLCHPIFPGKKLPPRES